MIKDAEFHSLQAELDFINGELVRTARAAATEIDDSEPLTEEQRLRLTLRGALLARRNAIMTRAAEKILEPGSPSSTVTKQEGMFKPLGEFLKQAENEPEPLLLRAVAIACERAYRRGVQHGTCAGKVDPKAVYTWRYPRSHKQGPAVAVAFHTPTFGIKGSEPATKRLEIEEQGLVTAIVHPDATQRRRALKEYLERYK